MLTATAAERTSVVRSLEELELRMAVRSALAVATADLASQREAMLSGEVPDAPGSVRIDRGENAPGIVVEFVPDSAGRVLAPEAGRLDLNSAPPESLGALPGMTEALAARIVRVRESSPFRSVAEALAVEMGLAAADEAGAGAGGNDGLLNENADETGTSPDGAGGAGGLTTADLPSAFDADFGDPSGDSASVGGAGSAGEGDEVGAFGEDGRGSWADLVTVFAADPQVACGASEPDRIGAPLVNVNAPWSDQLEQRVAEAVGGVGGSGDPIRTLFIDAPRLGSTGALVDLLNQRGVDLETLRGLLDALTTTADPFRLGLVDVNTAPVEVLATLPGLDRDLAEAIVDARERVDASERRSVVWLLEEGVLDDAAFRACVDRIAVRCLQWRFTVRASFEREGESFVGFDPDDAAPALLPEADEFGVAIEEEDEARTGAFVEFEVVLDLADATPRIAYLRERTAHGFAVAVASLPGFVGDFGDEDPEDEWGEDERGDLALEDDPGDWADVGGADREDESSAPGASFDGMGDSLMDESLLDLSDRGLFEDDEPGDGRVSSEPGRGVRSGGASAGAAGGGGSSSGDNRLGRWAPARSGSRGGSG